MEIVPVPAFADNYIWLVRDEASGETAVVDPGDAGPALAETKRRGWRVTQVWNTHHHWDHSGGIRAFAAGDNDGAVRLLEPAISELTRIGGSHAQRQLWEDTLIVAYMRAGHGDKAARRISARLDCRPSARDEAWSRLAQRN